MNTAHVYSVSVRVSKKRVKVRVRFTVTCGRVSAISRLRVNTEPKNRDGSPSSQLSKLLHSAKLYVNVRLAVRPLLVPLLLLAHGGLFAAGIIS
jgi:hypothetical protein